MANETNTEVVTENDNKVVDGDTVVSQETDKPETVVKEETPEAKRARIEGSLKRMAKDLEDMGIDPTTLLSPKPEPKKTSKKSNDLDRGDKAFLLASGIKADEFAFAQDVMKKTGLDLEELVSDDYFQTRLKTYREAKVSADAIPKSTRRSSDSPINSVDYHLNRKTPLNEIADTNLRRQVLNKRIELEKEGSKFSSSPVVNTLG